MVAEPPRPAGFSIAMSNPAQRSGDRLLAQQTALARFGELALHSDDLQEILHDACRLVAEGLGTGLAKVLELQPDGRTLLVRAGVGWKPGVVGHVTLKAESGTLEGLALSIPEAVVSEDTASETRFPIAEFMRDHGVRSLVNVTVIGADSRPPYGVLEVDSRAPSTPTRSPSCRPMPTCWPPRWTGCAPGTSCAPGRRMWSGCSANCSTG
jgi:hypothetical protein